MRSRLKSVPALALAAAMVMLSCVVTQPAVPAAAAPVTPQPSPTNFIGTFTGTTIGFDWAAPVGETAVRTGYSITGYDIETNKVVGGSPFTVGDAITHADVAGLPTNTIYAFRITATYAAPDTGTPTPLLYVVGPTATAIAGDVNQAPGGLVLSQVCGDYGALPSRAPTAGFPVLLPAADGVSGQGVAPTIGGISDPNFPLYPYPVTGSSTPPASTAPTTTVAASSTTVAASSTTVAVSSTTPAAASTTVATASSTTAAASTTALAASTTAVAASTTVVAASTTAAAASSTTTPGTTAATTATSTAPPTTVVASTAPPTTATGSTVPTTTTIPSTAIPGTTPTPTPTSCGVQMGVGTPITDGGLAGQYFSLNGRMNQVTVVDLRPIATGWTLNGVMGDVTHALGGSNRSFTGDHVGWDPVVTGQAGVPAGTNMGVVAGAPVDPMAPGLAVMQPLASAPAGSGTGVAVVDARLTMVMPVWVASGDYHGTLTLTLI